MSLLELREKCANIHHRLCECLRLADDAFYYGDDAEEGRLCALSEAIEAELRDAEADLAQAESINAEALYYEELESRLLAKA